MARRKKLPAVEFVETYDRQYGNGRFLEGTVANSAEFLVYNVTVCVNGNCRRVAPSTLQPGSQGKYAFPGATQDWRRPER